MYLLIYFPFPFLPAVRDGYYIICYFYFRCYLDHSVSTYLFSLSNTFCCSGWTLYVQSFSIFSSTRITVWLLIYIPFPLLPAVLFELYSSVFFYFLNYLDHSESTYLFSLYLTSCYSGWTRYIESFSISSANQITESLLIYFPFPFFPAILDGHYRSCHFLLPLLLG